MPQNTTNNNLGTPVEFQNPAASNVALVLDAETVGADPTTGSPLTREFVIPVESISGQSSLEVLVPILAEILKEIRVIRSVMQAESMPGLVDENPDDGEQLGALDSDPIIELEES